MDVNSYEAGQGPALRQRIFSTLRFFSLLEIPATLLELHRYLMAEDEQLKNVLDDQWEISSNASAHHAVAIDEIMHCLETECSGQVGCRDGFYFLAGQEHLVEKRLKNYLYGYKRERLIRRYARGLRFIPFVRGVALSGSQALGLQKKGSDIDLFILTDPKFLWLTRTLVTGYFQIIGKRRHGKYISNRFCLNHYVGRPKEVEEYKNIYTAFEYLKLRPLAYPQAVAEFQESNSGWMSQVFPNAEPALPGFENQSSIQRLLEKLFTNAGGEWIERKLKSLQLPKIRSKEKFIVATEDELSFHPDSKQQIILHKFFGKDKSIQYPIVSSNG